MGGIDCDRSCSLQDKACARSSLNFTDMCIVYNQLLYGVDTCRNANIHVSTNHFLAMGPTKLVLRLFGFIFILDTIGHVCKLTSERQQVLTHLQQIGNIRNSNQTQALISSDEEMYTYEHACVY